MPLHCLLFVEPCLVGGGVKVVYKWHFAERSPRMQNQREARTARQPLAARRALRRLFLAVVRNNSQGFAVAVLQSSAELVV